MEEGLLKNLNDLIDETIGELEVLKKSDRFSAQKVELKGPGDGIAGKPTNGSGVGKKDMPFGDEDGDEDDEDKKKEKEEAEKAEGTNRQADPNGGHHTIVKDEGVNRQADPNGGHHTIVKEDDEKKKKDKEKEEAEKSDKSGMPAGTVAKSAVEAEDLKKAQAEMTSLMKSMVDAAVIPLQTKIDAIAEMVKKIADQPMPSRGFTARQDVRPLTKSEGEVESLTKAQVCEKLMELKKSGKPVMSTDITSAELGGPADLAKIVNKYGLK